MALSNVRRERNPLIRVRGLRKKISLGWTYLVLSAVAVIFLIPFYWLVITSLKPMNQVFTDPPTWVPDPILWSNYSDALTSPAFPFFRLLKNTLFYTVLSTTGVVVSCTFIAYGFARLDFWGKDFLFGVTLSTMMLPSIVTLIPTYVLFRWFGWTGSYAPLIVPYFFGSAFNIFLLRQFFITLPWELTDAARVDGASEFYIFSRIMLPLVKPAILVVAVFHFMWTWNDLMGPLIYLEDSTQYPLILGLSAFQTRFGVEWNLMMAASMSVVFPLLVLFFLAQRYFIEGVVLTGLKGV
jgi:multiple sugar transport system permease protein